MPRSTSNIEPLARTLCKASMRRAGMPAEDIADDVDRLWHCVAAEHEAGLLDDAGHRVPHDFDRDLAAYRDWRARHPGYPPPPPRVP